MSWTLGSTTLPSPQAFARDYVERSVEHEAINGRSTREITSRKEKYVLTYQRISQTQVANILAEHAEKESLDFTVDDGDLQIATTEVHVYVRGRQYNTKGQSYREDLEIVLIEVE